MARILINNYIDYIVTRVTDVYNNRILSEPENDNGNQRCLFPCALLSIPSCIIILLVEIGIVVRDMIREKGDTLKFRRETRYYAILVQKILSVFPSSTYGIIYFSLHVQICKFQNKRKYFLLNRKRLSVIQLDD